MNPNKKKRLAPPALWLTASAIFLLVLCYPLLRSLVVMSVWDIGQRQGSLLEDSRISISIPSGLGTGEPDWYPRMLCYNADREFQSWSQRPDVRLSILYSFPAFSPCDGCSRLYDPESPYYCGFYGAYLAAEQGHSYGFYEEGGRYLPVPAEIADMTRFDYQTLVLQSFGPSLQVLTFDWELLRLDEAETYAGIPDWFVMDAAITANGFAHSPEKFRPAYLSYGRPRPTEADDFAPVTLYGRIYARYFPEAERSLFFYIIAADRGVVDRCDEQLLSQSRIALDS